MNRAIFKWTGLGLGSLLAVSPALAKKHCDCGSTKIETYRVVPQGTFTQYGSAYSNPPQSFSQSYGYVAPSSKWWVHGYQEPWPSQNLTLRGRIQDLRVFRFSGFDRPQLVAFVNTGGPELRPAILGAVDDLNSMELSTGDPITVTGNTNTIDGRTAVVASSFSTRQVRWSNPTPGFIPAAQWFNGTIRGTDLERINGERHTVAKVRLDDGSKTKVDLGPTELLPKMDIDDGDHLMVLARPGQIDGRQALIAERFQLNGTDVQLSRGAPAPSAAPEVYGYDYDYEGD